MGPLDNAPYGWLIQTLGPLLDLREAMDNDGLVIVCDPKREAAMRRSIRADFADLHAEMTVRVERVREASHRTIGGDGGSVWEP